MSSVQNPTPTPPPDASGGSQGQSNQKPPVIVVPPTHFRDPQQWAQVELTVRQVLQAADGLIAVARPNLYGQYRDLIGQLEAYFKAFRNYSAWAEYDFNRATLFMKDLSTIPMKGVADLVTRDAARKAVGESWRQWWSIYTDFKALAQRYATLAHIKDDLTAGITRPPADAPPLV